MRSLAVLSLHTSPLAPPGSGDSGGMNVYVRELVSSLAQAGVALDRLRAALARRPARRGARRARASGWCTSRPVRSICAKEKLPAVIDDFADGVARHLRGAGRDTDAIHANYWLSGVAGHRLKHEFELPLVSTFHTLARVKADTGDAEPIKRIEAEAEVIGCSDAILASCTDRGRASWSSSTAPAPERIEIVPPGVDHAFFSPGDRRGARSRSRPRRRAGAAVRRAHPAAQGAHGRGRARWPPWPTHERRCSSSAARAASTGWPSWPRPTG